MRRLVVIATAAALIATLAVPAIVVAGQERVPVCHLNDVGGFQRIEVAEPAYASHLSHGDGGIHEPVPGQPGYVFDTNCEPQPIILRITTLDATGTPRLLVQWEDTNADGTPSVGDVMRIGEFPIFSGPTTWDYVPVQNTELTVTAVDSAWRYDGPIPAFVDNFGITAWSGSHAKFWFGQWYGSHEMYDEAYIVGDTAHHSRVWDSSDPYKWPTDYTGICWYSPSRPGQYPFCPPLAHGDWTNDLLQIALYW